MIIGKLSLFSVRYSGWIGLRCRCRTSGAWVIPPFRYEYRVFMGSLCYEIRRCDWDPEPSPRNHRKFQELHQEGDYEFCEGKWCSELYIFLPWWSFGGWVFDRDEGWKRSNARYHYSFYCLNDWPTMCSSRNRRALGECWWDEAEAEDNLPYRDQTVRGDPSFYDFVESSNYP